MEVIGTGSMSNSKNSPHNLNIVDFFSSNTSRQDTPISDGSYDEGMRGYGGMLEYPGKCT